MYWCLAHVQITYGNYMSFRYEYFFDTAELEVINRLSATAYEFEFPKVSFDIVFHMCICMDINSSSTCVGVHSVCCARVYCALQVSVVHAVFLPLRASPLYFNKTDTDSDVLSTMSTLSDKVSNYTCNSTLCDADTTRALLITSSTLSCADTVICLPLSSLLNFKHDLKRHYLNLKSLW
jgi:hypothetical protein